MIKILANSIIMQRIYKPDQTFSKIFTYFHIVTESNVQVALPHRYFSNAVANPESSIQNDLR